MKLKTIYMPIIVAVVLLIGIYGSKAVGIWSAEEVKEPTKIASGEFEGMPDPEDIRGSYSFADIGEAFDIDPSVIAHAFGVETDQPELIKAKDLEELYPNLGDDIEIGTGAIKTFVALYTGLPYVGEDGIPAQAVAILKEEGKWSEELDLLYEGLIVDLPNADGEMTSQVQEENAESANTESSNVESSDEDQSEAEEHDEVVVGEVKGKTTVAHVIEWGLTLEQIEDVLGVEVENTNMVIRDICNSNGISFGDVKTALAALVP